MVPTLILVETGRSVLVSSMGFVKRDLESIAEKLAATTKLAQTPLFKPNESVPANRPG